MFLYDRKFKSLVLISESGDFNARLQFKAQKMYLRVTIIYRCKVVSVYDRMYDGNAMNRNHVMLKNNSRSMLTVEKSDLKL